MTSKMTSTSPLSRPRLPYQNPTSSSLSRMEKSLSKPLPPLGRSYDSKNLGVYGMTEKPLPPTPRDSSSSYSMQTDEKKFMHEPDAPDGFLPPRPMLQQISDRASTSRVPDATPQRPKLTQDPQIHALSDPILEARQLKQQDFEKTNTYRSQFPMPKMRSNFSGTSKINHSRAEPHNGVTDADQHANNYKAVLHSHSSNPPTLICEPYSNYSYLPSRMSSRITDVIDQSLLPPPLSYSRHEENSRPSSHFSTSSSELDNFPHGVRDSLRTYARKAFHLDKKGHKKTKSGLSEMPLVGALTPRRTSATEATVGQRRGSIQQGLSHMNDTLANFSIQSTKPKPEPPASIDIPNGRKVRVPREVRSPAVPITPYQKLGRESWKKPSKTDTRLLYPDFKSARTSDSPNPHGKGIDTSRYSTSIAARPVSIMNKVTSAFHTGTVQLNTLNVRRIKTERRREALKKKIVVIGLGDHKPVGMNDHDWV